MGRPLKAEQWQRDDGLALLEHWKRNDLADAEIAKKDRYEDLFGSSF